MRPREGLLSIVIGSRASFAVLITAGDATAYRIAIEKVEKGLRYAYRDRRNRKRDFRALWIQRINAGAREHGLTYSQFMHGIKLAGVDLDRKVLSDIAIREPEAFQAIAATARAALAAAPPAATAG